MVLLGKRGTIQVNATGLSNYVLNVKVTMAIQKKKKMEVKNYGANLMFHK